MLSQDDFNGEEKANLTSSIAQVGKPEDMVDLVTLIRADIDRMRRGRAARMAGDHGPLGNGGVMSYTRWHTSAVMHLDPTSAEQILIDLLSEPEYRSDVAAAMAAEFIPKQERPFGRTLHYDLMWAVREGNTQGLGDDQRRMRFATALNTELSRMLEQNQEGTSSTSLLKLASALTVIDGPRSTDIVLEAIAMPDQGDPYSRLDAARRLLIAGIILPTSIAFALVDPALERTERYMQNSDRYLLCSVLELCPFVDDPTSGIAKIRDVLDERRLWGHDLRELIIALGESRSDASIDLMCELASDEQTFRDSGDVLINGISKIDTPRAHRLLLGFVDPDIREFELTHPARREDVLAARLAELAQRVPELATRLHELCERDLPDLNRHILSRVMELLGTPEALEANLCLIDDSKPSPIPQGTWGQVETAFIEQQPYEQQPNVYTLNARASNELRARLYRMATSDEKGRKAAFSILGHIELWRLQYGKPAGEWRHPDLESSQTWPSNEPFS